MKYILTTSTPSSLELCLCSALIYGLIFISVVSFVSI